MAVLDLVFYYFLAFFPTFLLYFSRSANRKSVKYKMSVLLACLIPALFFGIRYNVGTDWATYYDHYNWISFDIPWNSASLEPGYYYLVALCKSLGFDFYFFSFVCGFLIEFAILKALNNFHLQKFQWLGYLLSIFTVTFVAYNITRQMMATSFVLLFYSYYKQNKRVKSVLSILLAVSFHKTAFLGLVIVFIERIFRRLLIINKERILMTSLFLCLLGLILAVPFISLIQFFGIYTSSEYSSHAFSISDLGFLLYYIPEWIVLYLAIGQKCSRRIKECYTIFMLSGIFQFVACLYPFADRLSWYFVSFRVLLYPMVLGELRGIKKRRFERTSVCWFAFYFFMLFFVIGGDGLFPYKTFLQ